MLDDVRVELCAEGTHADALAHPVHECQRAWCEERAQLPDEGADRRADRAQARRREEALAEQQRDDLVERDGKRQAIVEVRVDAPDALAPAVLGIVAIQRKARVLERPQVTPDRPDAAAELARAVRDGQPARTAHEAEQAPLAHEVVTSHDGVFSPRRPGRSTSMRSRWCVGSSDGATMPAAYGSTENSIDASAAPQRRSAGRGPTS
jgi:hypothetical protein